MCIEKSPKPRYNIHKQNIDKNKIAYSTAYNLKIACLCS